MLDLDGIYENLDKMASMKRHKPPTPGYFPSVAEINTYAKSKDFPFILEYLLWLDENLSIEDREKHKEAVSRLREIVSEMEDDEEEYGGDNNKMVGEPDEDDECTELDEIEEN